MTHWLLHVFGIDTQQSMAYDFWSGVATQLPLPNWIIAFIWYRHNNCHNKWCIRLGKHEHDGTKFCKNHRPILEPVAA